MASLSSGTAAASAREARAREATRRERRKVREVILGLEPGSSGGGQGGVL